ncbi:MAG: hypothetical protein J6Y58_00475 [Clostridiales bacterium]|nr:hypothetical protein [Clostridiales bacterium]
MICRVCGKEFADDSKFCLFCGTPVAAPAPAPAPMPQPVQYQQPYQQPVPQQYQQAPQPYQQPVPQQYQQAPQPYQQPVPQMNAGAAPVQAPYNPAEFAPVGTKPKRFDIAKPDTIILLASCALLFVSLFLKLFGLKKKVRFVEVAATLLKVPVGWLYMINVVLILIFLFVGLKLGVFIMSILNTCACGLVILVNEASIKDLGIGEVVERGPGYFLSIIASVLILAGGIMIFIRRNKEKRASSSPVPLYPAM